MSAHKFKIGQFVNCNPRSNSIGAGLYQIAQLMPPAGDEPQYRIKSQVEDHLRAALESERRPSTTADMEARRPTDPIEPMSNRDGASFATFKEPAKKSTHHHNPSTLLLL